MEVSSKMLIGIRKPGEVQKIIDALTKKGYYFVPIGGTKSNAGHIELASDPVSPIVERVTNMIDAVLEYDCAAKNSGQSLPLSPREAVARWRSVKGGHVYNLPVSERQSVADNVVMTFGDAGKGKDLPTVMLRDYGIGQHPTDLHNTILSLSFGNKIDKHYLAGAYGQGGSSTYWYCPFSIIMSRRQPSCLGNKNDCIGWTIVRANDSDLSLKTAVYEYLVDPKGKIPVLEDLDDFAAGTYIAHIAYDAGRPGRSVSLEGYRIFHYVMFDPILPFWIEDERTDDGKRFRRVVGGNAARLKESDLVEYPGSYTKHLDDGDKLEIRYWVMKVKTTSGAPYLDGFLEKEKSPDTVVITLNGQRQHTFGKSFLKQRTGLSFLANYLLVQVECDSLGLRMKRRLFAATREKARDGQALGLIQDAIVEALEVDDAIQRLELERRQQQTSKMNEEDKQKVKKLLDRYISKVLNPIANSEVAAGSGLTKVENKPVAVPGPGKGPAGTGTPGTTGPRKPPAPLPPPIPALDPPTFLSSPTPDPLRINAGGKGTLKLETDAPDDYLTRAVNPGALNVQFVGLQGARVVGQTGLVGGRCKLSIFVPKNEAGTMGHVFVSMLGADSGPLVIDRAIVVEEVPEGPGRTIEVVQPTEAPAASPWDVREVKNGDPAWIERDWDDSTVGEFLESQGQLVFLVSVDHTPFVNECDRKSTPEVLGSFRTKYVAMIAFNLWLHYQSGLTNGTPDDDALQKELQRTAQTLILSMRSEAELNDQD